MGVIREPKTTEEIVEGAYARGVVFGKSTEDGINRNCSQLIYPVVDTCDHLVGRLEPVREFGIPRGYLLKKR
jgi:hypothetical protein